MLTLKMVLYGFPEKVTKISETCKEIFMAQFRYSQTILLRFSVILFYSNLYKKIMSNEQEVTSNEQKVTSNKQKVTSNEHKVTSNELKVTSNEQKVTSNQ